MTKRVLFLMSDTGGGHRAAAEAIREALHRRYGADRIAAELVDVFREMRFPANYMPEFYPWIVNKSKTSWGLSYKLSNTHRRATLLSRGMYIANATRLKRMAQRHQADVVVVVHSVIMRPAMQGFRALRTRPPFLTVVTDLVSTHMFWYDRRVQRCFVPTQTAYERGIRCGLTPDQLHISGLPVHPGFLESLTDQGVARAELGWHPTKPTILLIGGGEGMGPLYETARAINAQGLDCQLVVVAGKNKALKQRLDASDWHQPTHIYPFVTNMPQLMMGADVLVTKAGPATITEATIAGLPMILYDAIPGQEEGNVDFVVQNGAGVFAPNPQKVARVTASWLAEGREGLTRRSANARRIARPDAVWQIAEAVWQWAHQDPIVNHRQTPARDGRVHTHATTRPPS